MAEIRIFLTNLAKYNEGELVGEWVDLPVYDDFEEVFDRIGIGDPAEGKSEEWFITDYESDIDGLEIGEYEDIRNLNEFAELIENFNDTETEVLGAILADGIVGDLIEAVALVRDGSWHFYHGAKDMGDVAHQLIDEGMYEVGDFERQYFDYDMFGDTLDSEGTFIVTNSGIVEID